MQNNASNETVAVDTAAVLVDGFSGGVGVEFEGLLSTLGGMYRDYCGVIGGGKEVLEGKLCTPAEVFRDAALFVGQMQAFVVGGGKSFRVNEDYKDSHKDVVTHSSVGGKRDGVSGVGGGCEVFSGPSSSGASASRQRYRHGAGAFGADSGACAESSAEAGGCGNGGFGDEAGGFCESGGLWSAKRSTLRCEREAGLFSAGGDRDRVGGRIGTVDGRVGLVAVEGSGIGHEVNLSRGKNYKRNKANRDRLRRQNVRRKVVGADEVVSDETDESVVKGRCETVVSQVQPVWAGGVADGVPAWRRKTFVVGGKPAALSVSCQEAEQMARETLALRRAMENKVAVRKAELQLRSLNDEKKCQDYDDLKRQRVIQWQNQALAKSQSSARSLEPGSSVSMREFREKEKRCEDLEYKQQKTMRVVTDLCGGIVALKVLDAVEAVGEGTLMDQEAQDVCGDGGPEVWGFDVDEVGVC